MLLSSLIFEVSATDYEKSSPYVVDFVLTSENEILIENGSETRATDLIFSYGLGLTKSGTTLNITGKTIGSNEVVKAGFKDLEVERRKTSSDSWKTYYDYGNVYRDAGAANLNTTLVVEAGYQYRISCKHYAKKSLLSTQTISNTSNIVTVS